MNAVEIEEAVSKLAEQAFEATEFPFAFLEAFGNKANTIKRLRSTGKSTTNKTDVGGDGVVAVLQRNNIHVAALNPVAKVAKTFGPDAVGELLKRLTRSPATAKHKGKFALVTDGECLQAANLKTGETLVCDYAELADHFGFFLELAGISTVRQIRENAFDIKATGRLNRLYVELLRHNPDWDGAEHREHLNHFFARLIFCFFAEDTGIFHGNGLFTETVRQMSEPSGANTHFVLAEIFRAMDVPMKDREAAGLRSWAGQFPYVNGGLFGHPNSGSAHPASGRGAGGEGLSDPVPKFTQIARSYLLHIGSLDWTRINPDIFGSMIQAVAEDEERGALGMHYTSVPNILKVLNPLFLDELRDKLDEAGTNARKLLNLRKRLARIRVFDPACGSGNFLVIAYKQMREIEAEINQRRGEADRATDIPLTNFRGIEIRHFAAEVARLALVIAEYQCDELHRGQRLALAEFLPLDNENWITHGNALRLDWLKVCPPTGTGGVKLTEDDLFQTPLDQPKFDFENEGGETYICGNPPYQGSVNQTLGQKQDMAEIFQRVLKRYKDLDYVSAFVLKAARYNKSNKSTSAFVTTNSLTQGEQVGMLWPLVFKQDNVIEFAQTSFLWSNLASKKAAVTCVILGLTANPKLPRKLYQDDEVLQVANISPYLVASESVIVRKRTRPLSAVSEMQSGNKPTDNGNLILTPDEKIAIQKEDRSVTQYLRHYVGSRELINGGGRWCIWLEDEDCEAALGIPAIAKRVAQVREFRLTSRGKQANDNAETPHRFVFAPHSKNPAIAVPNVSSVARPYLPCQLTSAATVVSNLASVIYNAPLWNMAIVASKLHLAWIAIVCGKLKTDYRYSNTLGWNTFPVPRLSDQNKSDLTRCAEDILLAREAHWPATIAELYDPEKMPDNLRAAHDRNDDTLERIYIGRRFKNDTERLETLFQMYTEMTAKEANSD